MRNKNTSSDFISVLATICLIFIGVFSLQGATQNIDGRIENESLRINEDGYLSFDIIATSLVYCTRGFPSRFHATNTSYSVTVNNKSGVSINSRLVALETFKNTIESGMYGHFYEDVHADVHLSPDFHFGKIIGHNRDNNTIDIMVPRTQKIDHFENTPDTIITVGYSDQANFYIEESPSNETQAMEKLGKWIQVHPPRQQMLWLETEASAYDYTRLTHYEDAGRGSANSATGMAYFDAYTDNGNIEIYRKLHDDTINEVYSLATGKSWLDGKLCPPSVAIKPGREFAACCRRSGTGIDEEMVRSRDDEIRGTITAINGNLLTIAALDWDRNPYTTTVNVATNGRIWLDGNDTTENAIEVGMDIRIYPERAQQRIVVLNEYEPGTSSTYQPIAYFSPDKPNATGNHEFTFDGSHSYDLDGTITSYEWDFGDGDTASDSIVTHTFNNGNEYKSYKVVLTVSNSDGETATNTQYISVMPEQRKAENISIDDLKQGLVHKEWLAGCDFGLNLECGEPDINEIVNNTMKANNGGLNEYSGYINIPEDGWYEFRLTRYPVKLWIGDWFVVDNQRESWGIWGYNNKKGDVYLEAGLHPITYQTSANQSHTNLIGISGPGFSPRLRSIDEMIADGDSRIRPMRLVVDEDLYYHPNMYLKAVASADTKHGEAPLSVNFSADSSLGDIDSYTWIFGDGDTTYTKNPTHTFDKAGYYKTTLIVTNPAGNIATKTLHITVNGWAVEANANVIQGDAPLDVSFSASAITIGSFPEDSGMVVIEAENFHGLKRNSDVVSWLRDSIESSYSGSGYITTADAPNALWGEACEAFFDITFSTPGDYYVWIRRNCASKSTNSVFIGMDNMQIGSDFDNNNENYNSWTWYSGGPVSVEAGTHRFNLQRRENNYHVDKIILTSDNTFIPTGEGPPESDQGAPPSSISYSWNFGDGGTSSLQNPVYTYTENGTYNAVVTADDGILTQTDVVRIDVGVVVGTSLTKNQTFPIAYPNPNTGLFQIRMDPSTVNGSVIKVYSMLGEIIMTKKINSQSSVDVDLSAEPNGIYFIKIGDTVERIIKQQQ